VRFGNVLGSRGSVLPTFQRQIARGGPVTITHPAMTRYFMTLQEAVRLILQAAAMGKNGEVFVLDMGEPIRVLQLAENLIRLCGYRPYEDIEIRFTGRRAGEKLYEQVFRPDETLDRTAHPKIYVAPPIPGNGAILGAAFESLCQAALAGQGEQVRRILRGLPIDFDDAHREPSLDAPEPG
jgi:FlaA1/EpsC-like NDP-sugar epimerase